MSHKAPKVNNILFEVLSAEYQIIFEYGFGTKEVNRLILHTYIGMELNYTKVGQLKITMLEYIDGILDDFDKADTTDGGTKSSDGTDNIFKAGKDCIN